MAATTLRLSGQWKTTPKRIDDGRCASQLYEGYNVVSCAKVAVKVFNTDALRKLGRREAELLQTASIHPNVVHLLAVKDEATNLSLFFEYCGGGDLLSLTISEPRYVHVRAHRFFRQLVSGLEFLHHHCGVAHRDLKLEHILLNTHRTQVLIGGFSHSERLCDEPYDDFYGALPYAAPEIVSRRLYTGEPVDVWALGVILYAMLYSVFPFDAEPEDALREQILHDEPTLPDDEDSEEVSLLQRMLCKDGALRASVAEIRHSRFLTERIAHAA